MGQGLSIRKSCHVYPPLFPPTLSLHFAAISSRDDESLSVVSVASSFGSFCDPNENPVTNYPNVGIVYPAPSLPPLVVEHLAPMVVNDDETDLPDYSHLGVPSTQSYALAQMHAHTHAHSLPPTARLVSRGPLSPTSHWISTWGCVASPRAFRAVRATSNTIARTTHQAPTRS